jgi:hypothetical protein
LIKMQETSRQIAAVAAAHNGRKADDQVVATVAYPEEVVRGDYATLAKELDRRRYERLRIELDDGTSFGDRFYLEWKAKAERSYDRDEIGVKLYIRSKDRGWAMQAVAQITDEIDRGRPKWEWIYGWKGNALLVLSLVVTACVIIYSLGVRFGGVTITNAIQTHQYGLMASFFGFFVFAGFMLYFFITIGPGLSVIHRIMPPVEILAIGQSPSAMKAIGYVFGVIVVPTALAIILAYAV